MIGYERASIPRIPTRSQVRTAGVEGEWERLLGEDAIREAVREANTRIAGEVNWSHLLWDPLRDFELAHLARNKSREKVEIVKQIFVARLRVPHRAHEATAQVFSSFISQNMAASDYESTMASLQKPYSNMKTAWASIERYEDQIRAMTDPNTSEIHWSTWKTYLRTAASSKNADQDRVSALFERCIATLGLPPSLQDPQLEEHPPIEAWEAEHSKQRYKLGREARQALEKTERDAQREACRKREDVWSDYIFFLTISKAPASQMLEVLERAVRMLPASGTLWAAYLRHSARLGRSEAHVVETFTRALEGGECVADDLVRQQDGVETKDHMVELLVGRVDAERERAAIALGTEQGCTIPQALAQLPKDSNAFSQVYALMMATLEMPADRPAAASDKQLRLQRLAAAWAEGGMEGLASLGEAIWETALRQQPTNGLVWLESAALQARLGNIRKARSLYRQGCSRNGVTDRSQLMQQWKNFEQVYGGAEDVTRLDEKLRRERDRQWEEWAQYAQLQQEQYAAYSNNAIGGMEIDGAEDGQQSLKRGHEDDEGGRDTVAESTGRIAQALQQPEGSTKKGKTTGDDQPSRDRENASVLVSGMPIDATDVDLQRLFKDCGPIREISGPLAVASTDPSQPYSAGTVEFMDRSSVPAARTKDKKRMRGQEISVSLGWECTLYVTNFPEEMDDAAMKELFGKYGPLYEVRWPSKKFDSSRRFCYVQYTTPVAAREALVLHKHQLAPTLALEVYLTDPNRRKQRTDANANDREIFVSAIHKSCQEEDIKPLFEAQGTVAGFRMLFTPEGKAQGKAFVDFATPLEAQKAIAELNGKLVKGKAIRVQLVDPAKATKGGASNGTGPPGFQARAIKVCGLPLNTQEALIQQFFEKVAGGVGKVKKVEWTAGAEGRGNAIVELDDPSTAGRLTMLGEVEYDASHRLTLLSLERTGAGRGGLGFVRPSASLSQRGAESAGSQAMDVDAGAQTQPKGQDAFRQMLSEKR
ncbi:hypothetical protein BCV69DRAFT_302620 [Microstroma glucosiphilum]|uniref:U4/U6 snRNA-associated-splicing factor PRP24 n=1 Tax=Pseudomicrostroma glucosiphilum TaxID=1684307 RepID=A0A316UFH9_9BASI|nr:hypothetical protein BCV69DRAFT_302620 [Pseudomicrostroma glucosiphilum]PWN24006.1 hypothetical protein BCV69DRAFT_302620 [Pseudomicrostroma glucosiphilum]